MTEPQVNKLKQAMNKVDRELDVRGILNERNATHGDYTNHAACAQDLKQVLYLHVAARYKRGQERLTPAQQEAIDMILHKIARIVAGDNEHRDHWDDIAGYATLAADRVKNDG
jgi:hypothetical protein